MSEVLLRIREELAQRDTLLVANDSAEQGNVIPLDDESSQKGQEIADDFQSSAYGFLAMLRELTNVTANKAEDEAA